jgi:hypothetical protein
MYFRMASNDFNRLICLTWIGNEYPTAMEKCRDQGTFFWRRPRSKWLNMHSWGTIHMQLRDYHSSG